MIDSKTFPELDERIQGNVWNIAVNLDKLEINQAYRVVLKNYIIKFAVSKEITPVSSTTTLYNSILINFVKPCKEKATTSRYPTDHIKQDICNYLLRVDRSQDLELIANHGDGSAPFVENAAKWALQRIKDLENQTRISDER